MAATAISQPRASLWQSLKEAVRGTRQDFTEGSISRAILLLATPMVLEMLMESLFAIVNVFWVTRLGANAVATVGLTESMLTLVFSVAIGISMSTTAMVARRIGEKNPAGASTAGAQAILLGVVVALATGCPHGSLRLDYSDGWAQRRNSSRVARLHCHRPGQQHRCDVVVLE